MTKTLTYQAFDQGLTGGPIGKMYFEVARCWKRRKRGVFHKQVTLLTLENKEEWSDVIHYLRAVLFAALVVRPI